MKLRALLLFCVAVLFALTPLMLPGFRGYNPEDFPVQILKPAAQPAGYAFSIWALIYAGLMAHAVYGLVRQAKNPDWDRNRIALMAAMLLGMLWVAFADSRPVLATGIILAMAVAALTAVLQTGRSSAWQLPPVALFAGWVTAAAGVASGITAAGLGWLGNAASAYAALAAVLIVALALQHRLGRVPAYAAAIIWALIGIAVSNWGQETGLVLAALAGAGALVVTPFLRA